LDDLGVPPFQETPIFSGYPTTVGGGFDLSLIYFGTGSPDKRLL